MVTVWPHSQLIYGYRKVGLAWVARALSPHGIFFCQFVRRWLSWRVHQSLILISMHQF